MKEILTDAAFRKKIEQSPTGGYLFFGDEDYLKAHALKAARLAACPDPALGVFNDMTVDPSSSESIADAIANAVMAAPMMADTKAVTVSGLSVDDLKPSDIDGIAAAAAMLDEYDCNLLVISVPAGMLDTGYLPKSPSAAFKKLAEHLTPVQFSKVPAAKLESWIVRHFEHNGLRTEGGVPAAMISRCGSDMYTLANEIDKLSFYALSHGMTSVSLPLVPLITSANEDYDTFALSNAIAAKNSEAALDILAIMKARRIEPVIILSELSRTLGDMLAVKLLLQNRKNFAEIGSAIGVKSEYKVKLTAQSVKNLTVAELQTAVSACAAADAALKLSPTGYIEIEKLICSL